MNKFILEIVRSRWISTQEMIQGKMALENDRIIYIFVATRDRNDEHLGRVADLLESLIRSLDDLLSPG
ncbi:MAG: hypothetical protein ACF788_01250 [Novipirellula sp. JB048]